MSPRSCLETCHCQSPTSLCVTSWTERVIFRRCYFGTVVTVGASEKLVTVTKSQIIKSQPTAISNVKSSKTLNRSSTVIDNIVRLFARYGKYGKYGQSRKLSAESKRLLLRKAKVTNSYSFQLVADLSCQ